MLKIYKSVINSYNFKLISSPSQQIKYISTSCNRYKAEDRRQMLASLPAKDEGTGGERSIDIDSLMTK